MDAFIYERDKNDLGLYEHKDKPYDKIIEGIVQKKGELFIKCYQEPKIRFFVSFFWLMETKRC